MDKHSINAEHVRATIQDLESTALVINYAIVWDIYHEKYKGVQFPDKTPAQIQALLRLDIIRSDAIE